MSAVIALDLLPPQATLVSMDALPSLLLTNTM